MSDAYRNELYKLLNKQFDEDEVRDLCATLGVVYDQLPGNSKASRLRGLILLLAQQLRLQELIDLAAEKRPYIAWPPLPDKFDLADFDPLEKSYPLEMSAPPPDPDALHDFDITKSIGDVKSPILRGDDIRHLMRGDKDWQESHTEKRTGGLHFGDHNVNTFDGPVAGGDITIHHHNYGTTTSPEAPKIKEEIRLDAALPAQVFRARPFDMAVAVRQLQSPQLAIPDLPVVVSETGQVFRSETAEIIQYRIEVSGKDFHVKPESYTLQLSPRTDSETCFFQITPLRAGELSLLINAYQENDAVVAHTRIKLAVAVEVTTEMQYIHYLVSQLRVYLHAAPPAYASLVTEIEGHLDFLLKMSAAEQPNLNLIQMIGANLIKSTQKLELTAAADTANQIATAVTTL